MRVTKLSSREFNQDVGRAKRAAKRGPVVITDRGEPAYVLLRHADYCRLAGSRPTIGELLEQRNVADFEFDPPKVSDGVIRAADLA